MSSRSPQRLGVWSIRSTCRNSSESANLFALVGHASRRQFGPRASIRHRGFLVGVLLLAWMPAAFGQVPAEPVEVRIDSSVAHQTIRGFGASGAWWSTWFHRLETEEQEHALDLLFTDQGADLDIFRFNLPSASSGVSDWRRRTVDVEVAPFEYDLDRDRFAMDVLKRVIERGVGDIVLFSNSPPARLTRNGVTSGGPRGGSNLREGAEPEFARYLVELSERILDVVGLERARLSPINEPQWKWGEEDRRRWQDGCHYTPEQAAALARAVHDAVGARTPEGEARRLLLEVPDSGSWATTPEYVAAIWSDRVLREHLTSVAIHSYWSSREDKVRTREWLDANLPNVKILMTEYCEMRGGHDPSMVSGLRVARVLHDDLVVGGVSEWTWWLAMSSSRFNDGLIHRWLAKPGLQVTKRLWVLAHWSRFVEPGWVRIEAIGNRSSVLVSAFADQARERVVCVLVNPGDESWPISLLVNGRAATPSGLWVTDGERDLAPAVSAGLVPPRSVVTATLELAGQDGSHE